MRGRTPGKAQASCRNRLKSMHATWHALNELLTCTAVSGKYSPPPLPPLVASFTWSLPACTPASSACQHIRASCWCAQNWLCAGSSRCSLRGARISTDQTLPASPFSRTHEVPHHWSSSSRGSQTWPPIKWLGRVPALNTSLQRLPPSLPWPPSVSRTSSAWLQRHTVSWSHVSARYRQGPGVRAEGRQLRCNQKQRG